VRATGNMVDPLDPDRGPVVPLSYRTDGTWVWQEALAYYMRARGAAPELEFLCHIEERGYLAPGSVPDDTAAAAAALTRAGPPPRPRRPPMTYYRDSGGVIARARGGSVFEADVFRIDLRWGFTDELWKQRYQGSDYEYGEISDEQAVRHVDARWASGSAVPPLD
jgi:hypothetical protein